VRAIGDAVDFHRAQVVGRQRRIRQQPHQTGLQVRPATAAEIDDPRGFADQLGGVLDQFAQAVDLRSTELVSLAKSRAITQAVGENACHVADIDRLEARRAAAKRQDREQLDELGKHVEKGVIRPEDHRRTKHRDVQFGIAAWTIASPSPFERRYSDGALVAP
jgi:hypothetical protein